MKNGFIKIIGIILISTIYVYSSPLSLNSLLKNKTNSVINNILNSSSLLSELMNTSKETEITNIMSEQKEQQKESKRYKSIFDMGFEKREKGYNSMEIYIQKNISKYIGEIEGFKDYNIRENNYLQLYKTKKENSILKSGMTQGLEKTFAIGGMDKVFDDLKSNRINKCKEKQKEKRSECSKYSGNKKYTCMSELSEIESNCYKAVQKKSTGILGVASKIGSLQDKLLNKISLATGKIFKQNSSSSYVVNNNQKNSSSSIVTKMPILPSAPKINNTSNNIIDGILMPTINNEIKNQFSSFISDISSSDECNIMECLYYPRRSKYEYNKDGSIKTDTDKDGNTIPKYTKEYDSKCVSKKNTKMELAKKVLEFKTKVKVKATKAIIKHMFKELPANMIKKQNERAVACAFEAMENTILATDEFTEDFKDDSTNNEGINKGELEDSKNKIEEDLKKSKEDSKAEKSVVASEFSQIAKTVGECISLANTQTKEKKTLKGSINLHKGSPEIIYSDELITITSQMPFVSAIGGQVKAEMQELFTSGWKSSELIKQCIRKGQTDTYILNYNKCIQKDEDMDNTFEFNFKTPQLLDALRRQTKTECIANLKPSGSSLKWVFNEVNTSFKTAAATEDVKSKPSIGGEEYLSRWSELESKIKVATQILERLKIPYNGFLETKNATCAERFFNVLAEDSTKKSTGFTFTIPMLNDNMDMDCSILDRKEDKQNGKSTILGSNIKIDVFDESPKDGIPKDLYTSVKMLCKESAENIIRDLDGKEVPSLEERKGYYTEDSEFNPLNSRHAKGKKDKFYDFLITRSIANISFCHRFFKSVGKLGKSQNKNSNLIDLKYMEEMLITKTEYGDGNILKRKKDIFLKEYESIVKELLKLSNAQKFAFCIKQNKVEFADSDTSPRQGSIAAKDFCRDYKVSYFDKLLSDAKKDLDHPIITSEQRKLMRESINSRRLEMKTGVIQMTGGY
jgi:hypothetical protein